jgi:hypothetical protein
MNSKIFFLVLSILFVTSACNEYQISTKINADGTCERIIRVDSQSSSDKLDFLPAYVDSTWLSRTEKSKNDSLHVIRIFSKKFAGVDDLNKEISKGTRLNSEVKLEKKFRWFFTYFYYTETYRKSNPFKQLPLEGSFSKKEIDSLYNGTIGAGLSKKVEDHFEKCIKEEIVDSISTAMEKHSLYDGNIIQQLKGKLYSKKIEDTDDLTLEIENLFGLNTYRPMKNDIERLLKNIEKKVEDYLSLSTSTSFSTNVIMPGLILNTNAKSVEGNVLNWKPESENYLLCDYKMIAESRVANVWAIVVTTIIALILLAALLIPTLLRKRKA